MTEKRILTSDNLRSLCIKNNWYTKGSIQAYDNLLTTVDKIENVTTDDIVKIAVDIEMHSITDYPLTSICFEIAKICYTIFEENE